MAVKITHLLLCLASRVEAKVRHLWGFSATWWKVKPMHNAWGEREDFVWLLFIDHQSSAAAHAHTHAHTHAHRHTHAHAWADRLTRCAVTSLRSRKQEQRKKQESSNIVESGEKKEKETTRRNRNVDALFWDGSFAFDARTKRGAGGGGGGGGGAAGLASVSKMGFNRNTFYMWSYRLSSVFVPTVPTLQWTCL